MKKKEKDKNTDIVADIDVDDKKDISSDEEKSVSAESDTEKEKAEKLSEDTAAENDADDNSDDEINLPENFIPPYIHKEMPVICLRGTVLFPVSGIRFDAARPQTLRALKQCTDMDSSVLLVAQKDSSVQDPTDRDLYTVGTVAKISQVIRGRDFMDPLTVFCDGMYRAKLEYIKQYDPYVKGVVQMVYEDKPDACSAVEKKRVKARTRLAKAKYDRYAELALHFVDGYFPDPVDDIDDLSAGLLADTVANNMVTLSVEIRQNILEELDQYRRLEQVLKYLESEISLLEEQSRIEKQVETALDKSQREYYLREELRAIYSELGETDDERNEAEEFKQQLKDSLMPQENKDKLLKEISRFSKIPSSSPDSSVSRIYIEKCLALPWGKYTDDNFNITSARKQLDKDHYGLEKVKERIIETLAAIHLSPEMKGQIICLAGPPGVGKTSIAKSVAKAMGRKYARISLGGVNDEAEIRGHRRTYVGAIPGRIINAVTDAGSQNALILLDEIDKLSGDFRGDPASALLEVLDPEQNSTFTDHYIDMPFDLSRILFITTANDKNSIPEPLLDRMEIIDLDGYTFGEKLQIAKRHLVPNNLKEYGIQKSQLKITDGALKSIIDGYTREAGVRELDRIISKICRKYDVRYLEGDESMMKVSEKDLFSLLGPVKFRDDEDGKFKKAVGCVNGLAWTSVGGVLLRVEVAVMDGTGKITTTGSLGDVMKESAQIAVSVVRQRASEYGIDPDFYKNKDIHIHFPDGATPKDGPSAGVTMTTAIVSALSGISVRGDIAMTGEISLTGRVLPIGGLKEKSMAAYRHGIREVIIPERNEPDIYECDESVKNEITFIKAEKIDDVLNAALIRNEITEKTSRPKLKKKAGTKISPVKKEPSERAYD